MVRNSHKQKQVRSQKNQERRRNGQDVNRRNFLRLETLETRWAMAAAAMNDVFSTGIDQPLEVSSPGVLANDTSGMGMPMSASLFTGPAHGQLTFNSNGSFVYTPNAGYSGMDSFVYTADDGDAKSLLAAVTINISEGTAPVSNDDAFQLDEDETLIIPAVAGVLVNDVSVASASVALISGPASGELTLQPDGGFVYVPEANHFGEVSFTYQATNSLGAGNIATVTLSINSVNDVPVAMNDAFTVDEDQLLTSPTSVLANDSDIENSPLTLQLVSQPLHGTVSFNPDGTFSYQPNADFNGLDGFSYLVNDGTDNSEVATVTITVNPVNDAPVALNDEYTIDEDTVLTVDASGVLANDSDIDSTSLLAELVSAPQHGTVTLNSDGSFVYTPAANFYGVDGFSYHVNDGEALSDVATVTINVLPIADPPVAFNDEYTTAEDTELVIDAPGVLGNDSNPDGGSLTAQIVSQPLHGSVMLAEDGSLIYTPAENYNGVDGFSYTVSNGELTSAVATVTIIVTPVNDAPVAINDEYTTVEDTELVIDAPGVLGNDTDLDSESLTAHIVSQPLHGSVTLAENGSLIYTPAENFNGIDGFSYTVSDGDLTSEVASVTITVTPVNDPPVSVADEYTVAEDTPLVVTTGGVLENDSDIDSASLSATLVTGPTHGTLMLNGDGTFEYLPDADFHGEDSFTYIADDGELAGLETTVTITVTPVNDAPVSVADAYTVEEDNPLIVTTGGVLANDSDVDSASLTATLVTDPTNGSVTLNSDGTFEYVPNADFHGEDTFTYIASDGELAGLETTVTITVTPVNDAPVSVADSYTVEEDNPLIVTTGGVLENDSDVDSPNLTATLVADPTNGTVTLNSDGTFEYMPNVDFHGEDSFTYIASDGELAGLETTVTITVTSVNDKPMAEDDAYTTDENTPLVIPATGVLANDSDVDGDSLTASLVESPTNGTVTLNSDGSFVYTPNPGFAGTDSFIYAADDGTDAATAFVTITVNDVIQAPCTNSDAYNVAEDVTLNVSAAWGVLANDADPQGTILTAEIVTPPTNGQLVLDSSGAFQYTPDANWHGVDFFTYRAVNAAGEMAEGIATITVEAINDAPNALDDAYFVVAGGVLETTAATGVQVNDFDIDSSVLTSRLIKGPTHGTLVFNADGSFTYTPTAGYFGNDAFTYQLNDGMTNSLVGRVSIAVQGEIVVENTAPVGQGDSYSLMQDQTLTVDAPGVLANDTDADGDPLTAQLLTSATNGTVTLAADGSFVYEPNAGFVGSDSFTYAPLDGITGGNPVTVSLQVNSISNNMRPIAHNDHYVLPANAPFTVEANGILANDHDPENGTLIAVYFGGPQHGTVVVNGDGSFTYTPEPGYTGVDSFLYRIWDGELYSPLAAVTLRVEPGPSSLMAEESFPDNHSHDDAYLESIECIFAEGQFQLWS